MRALVLFMLLFAAGCRGPKYQAPRYPVTEIFDPVTQEVPDVIFK